MRKEIGWKELFVYTIVVKKGRTETYIRTTWMTQKFYIIINEILHKLEHGKLYGPLSLLTVLERKNL